MTFAAWVTRRAALILLALTAAGCGPSAISTPGGSPADISPGPSAETAACADVDLRTPGGAGVDLSGTWSGDGALFFVAQHGACIWWEELSAESPNSPLGARFRRVFAGNLRPDFTVVGRFGVTFVDPSWIVPAPGFVFPREGEAVYRVVIRAEGSTEAVTLEGPARESVDSGTFLTVVLTRVSEETRLP